MCQNMRLDTSPVLFLWIVKPGRSSACKPADTLHVDAAYGSNLRQSAQLGGGLVTGGADAHGVSSVYVFERMVVAELKSVAWHGTSLRFASTPFYVGFVGVIATFNAENRRLHIDNLGKFPHQLALFCVVESVPLFGA